jgi:hypothetical protein
MTQKEMENLVLAHRYKRYACGKPKLRNVEHDFLEDKARKQFPKSKVLNDPPSSIKDSYPEEIRKMAARL